MLNLYIGGTLESSLEAAFKEEEKRRLAIREKELLEKEARQRLDLKDAYIATYMELEDLITLKEEIEEYPSSPSIIALKNILTALQGLIEKEEFPEE